MRGRQIESIVFISFLFAVTLMVASHSCTAKEDQINGNFNQINLKIMPSLNINQGKEGLSAAMLRLFNITVEINNASDATVYLIPSELYEPGNYIVTQGEKEERVRSNLIIHFDKSIPRDFIAIPPGETFLRLVDVSKIFPITIGYKKRHIAINSPGKITIAINIPLYFFKVSLDANDPDNYIQHTFTSNILTGFLPEPSEKEILSAINIIKDKSINEVQRIEKIEFYAIAAPEKIFNVLGEIARDKNDANIVRSIAIMAMLVPMNYKDLVLKNKFILPEDFLEKADLLDAGSSFVARMKQ